MNPIYCQTCINGHPATVSPDNGKPWRCGNPECEYFDGADDTAYGEDSDPGGTDEDFQEVQEATAEATE